MYLCTVDFLVNAVISMIINQRYKQLVWDFSSLQNEINDPFHRITNGSVSSVQNIYF